MCRMKIVGSLVWQKYPLTENMTFVTFCLVVVQKKNLFLKIMLVQELNFI